MLTLGCHSILSEVLGGNDYQRGISMPLKRTHADDIECLIREDSSTYRTVYVKFLQSQTSFLSGSETTLDGAKRLADEIVVQKSAHHCNGACKNWEQF